MFKVLEWVYMVEFKLVVIYGVEDVVVQYGIVGR